MTPTPQQEPDIELQILTLQMKLDAARLARVNATIQSMVQEHRLTAEEAPKAIARACADETYLDELALRPRYTGAPFGVASCPH